MDNGVRILKLDTIPTINYQPTTKYSQQKS